VRPASGNEKPVLKFALMNQGFLTDQRHPARQLIDVIAATALRQDVARLLSRDPLTERAVARLLDRAAPAERPAACPQA